MSNESASFEEDDSEMMIPGLLPHLVIDGLASRYVAVVGVCTPGIMFFVTVSTVTIVSPLLLL